MENINAAVQVTVEEKTYNVYKLPPKDSIPIITKIMKIISPLLGSAATSGAKESGEDDENSEEKGWLDWFLDSEDIDITSIVNSVFDRIDEDDVYKIIKRCFSSVQYNGQVLSQVMEAHFMGKEMELFKVFGAVLEVQYGNFFAIKRKDMLPKDLSDEGIQLKPKKQK